MHDIGEERGEERETANSLIKSHIVKNRVKRQLVVIAAIIGRRRVSFSDYLSGV